MDNKKIAQRVAWFVVLWASGVIAVGTLAYGIRLIIR
jgi:Protein of unknown function (DUF2474)